MAKTHSARIGAASLIADLILTVLFVAIGRSTHEQEIFGPWGMNLGMTAWPFLVGLGLGWLLVGGWRRPAAVLRTGVPIWAVTVGAGLLLRAAVGDGTALPFVIVATATLLVFLVGWRLLFAAVQKVRR